MTTFDFWSTVCKVSGYYLEECVISEGSYSPAEGPDRPQWMLVPPPFSILIKLDGFSLKKILSHMHTRLPLAELGRTFRQVKQFPHSVIKAI